MKRVLKILGWLSIQLFVILVIGIFVLNSVFGWRTVKYERPVPSPDGFRVEYLDQYAENSSCSALFKVMLIPEIYTVYETSGNYGIFFGAYSSPDNSCQTSLIEIRVVDEHGEIAYPVSSDILGKLDSVIHGIGHEGTPRHLQYAEWRGPYLMDLHSNGADQITVILEIDTDCDYEECEQQELFFRFNRTIDRGLFKFTT